MFACEIIDSPTTLSEKDVRDFPNWTQSTNSGIDIDVPLYIKMDTQQFKYLSRDEQGHLHRALRASVKILK